MTLPSVATQEPAGALSPSGGRFLAGGLSLTLAPVISTGLPDLDRRLPGGGWPLGGIVELYTDRPSALPVLLPALRTLSWENRWVMLVRPPRQVIRQLESRRDLDLSNWLLIHEHPRLGPLALAERTLAARTSVAVVAWADSVAPAELPGLRRAQGGADTLLFLLAPAAALPEEPGGTLRVRAVTPPTAGLTVQVLHTPWHTDPPRWASDTHAAGLTALQG